MLINNINYNISRFSSGEMKLHIEDLLNLVQNNEVNILYNGEISMFELMIIIEFYQSNDVLINLTLCYLPYQRMDKNNGKEVCTIKLVANIINKLRLNKLFICEPHCNIDYFNNAKIIPLVEKIYNKAISIITPSINDKIVFTDAGSHQKYGHLSTNSIYFRKHRSLETGLIDKHEIVGDISNARKFVIIDDIISSGDTIISCIDMLPADSEIYIICGHFEDNKYNLRLLDLPQVKGIFSSNSLLKKELPKLKLYDISELIK